MVGVGIDLGTTYSCVAVWKDGNVEVIANEQGNKTTPSYVAFTSNERLIGEAAKNQASFNPGNTVFGTKRLIGRRYDDIGVQLDLRHWPFQVVNDNGKPKILVQYKGQAKHFTPEEISGMVLFRMKQVAEAHLGTKVQDAVITVPAYFNDAQRQATRTAGKIAGLNVRRILNEPTAAALAYGLDRNLRGERNVLVYDLGGGTFDVSVLTIGQGSVYEVKATTGNSRLGGEDFDNRLVAYFCEDFRKRFRRQILPNPRALRRLKTAAERAKRTLTSATEATVEIESLCDNIDYYVTISRTMFEDLCSDLFRDTLTPIEQAISDAKLEKTDIHEVVLIGGSTRIPKIQSMLQEYLGRTHFSTSINADEAVACGAAIQAAILSGDNHRKIQDVLLVDVVPISLGVETIRGMMYVFVPRNTRIPCHITKELTTIEDSQTAMSIDIFEGERSTTKDNNFLGSFLLSGIPAAPRGVAKIDVTFDVDANGILRVTATDRGTGSTKSLIIKNNLRLSSLEVQRMIAEAEKFREEDIENRRCLEARNALETYIYSTKQTVVDKGEMLTDQEKATMMNEFQLAIQWFDENPDCLREEYERKQTELMRSWSGIMNKFYDPNWRQKIKRQRSESYRQPELNENEPARIEEVREEE